MDRVSLKVAPSCGPDSDGDGTGDNCESCPNDPLKIEPGACGCGTPDTDSDSDGTADCLDPDDDNDGTPDLADGCPLDDLKSVPGPCGCGTPDSDSDGDGIIDCFAVESVASLGLLPSAGALSGDDLGASVATDGAFAIVGLPLDDVGGKADAGSARIYTRSGDAWTQVAELTSPLADAKTKDYFGTSVAIHGDLAAVGVPSADANGLANSGAVYVFRRSGTGVWFLEQKLTRSSPAAGDAFGTSVAVRGNFVAAGSPLADAGAIDAGQATVFRFASGAWSAVATVSGSPATASDRAGQSVGLGGNATAPTLVVGTPGDDETAKANCGSVSVHGLASDGTVASSTRLVGNPAVVNAGLGQKVAVDGTGSVIAAGAPLADLAGTGTDCGSATVWRLSGSTWSARNLVPPGHAAGENFGGSVALDPTGATFVIGSPLRAAGGIAQRGSAVVFSRLLDGNWRLHDRLVVSGGSSASRFGAAVAIGASGILMGGPKNTPPAGGAVAAFALPVSCVGADSDGDGTGDLCDDCPNDPNKVAPGTCGCGTSDADTDGDGRNDCFDLCPLDPAKVAPGTCGCGVPDTDSDADGTADCLDPDDDNDGSGDATDGCPLDPAKTSPGTCGCGVADTDSDSDGTPNCNDLCPSDPAKVAPGTCGCGTADADADGDGLVDCLGLGSLGQVASFPSDGILTGDDFGAALAADGPTSLVGVPFDDRPGKTDAGSARVYTLEAGAWTQQAELLATDAKVNDQFGLAVAITGDLAVVGAPLGDVGATVDAGAAYVFRRNAGTWTFEQRLVRTTPAASDRFGSSVAALGDFIAVGAPLANALGQADSGEVTVFKRVAGVWTATFVSTSNASGDKFGTAVVLGGDATAPTMAAGAPGDDEPSRSNCGAVYVYGLSADGLAGSVRRLVAVPAVTNAGLGTSLAISAAGTRIAAGAPLADATPPGADCGSATVWSFAAGTWTGVQLAPADRTAGERFGSSVAFRPDGLAIVVGSPYDTVGGVTQRGSAAVFTFDGSAWRMFDRLTLPADGTSASRFGTAAGFGDGGILVGAPKHTPPAGGTVRGFAGP